MFAHQPPSSFGQQTSRQFPAKFPGKTAGKLANRRRQRPGVPVSVGMGLVTASFASGRPTFGQSLGLRYNAYRKKFRVSFNFTPQKVFLELSTAGIIAIA